MSSTEDQLGSLAQSTRGNDLGKIRGMLLFIGVMTLAVNGFLFGNAQNEVQQAGIVAEQQATILGLVRMIYGAGLLLGIVFIACGIFIKKYPVPLTILSLILYVGSTAGFAFLDPKSLAQGIVIKIIIIVALGKSVQTALAFERDRASGNGG